MIIKTGKSLKVENVLLLRKKVTQFELNEEMLKISRFLKANELKKVGPMITTTFAIEDSGVIDMEILVPIDRVIVPSDEYKFKSLFEIENALYIKYEGNPEFLQDTYKQMIEYIKGNRLQQATPIYNVEVKEMLPGMSYDEFEIDIYIGISKDNV